MPYKNGSEFTTIGIAKETAKRLKKWGLKGEMYEEILVKILDYYEEHHELSSIREIPRGHRR